MIHNAINSTETLMSGSERERERERERRRESKSVRLKGVTQREDML